MRFLKRRIILFVSLLCCCYFLLRFMTLLVLVKNRLGLHLNIDDSVNEEDALTTKASPSVMFVLREFEDFDHDIVKTIENVLSVCSFCGVVLVSDFPIYPPLKLPKSARHLILSPDISHKPVDFSSILKSYEYVSLIPDGARLSSFEQILDLIRMVKSVDSVGVVASVGSEGSSLTCHQVSVIRPLRHHNLIPRLITSTCRKSINLLTKACCFNMTSLR